MYSLAESGAYAGHSGIANDIRADRLIRCRTCPRYAIRAFAVGEVASTLASSRATRSKARAVAHGITVVRPTRAIGRCGTAGDGCDADGVVQP
jgi:hypothetical protein